MSSLAELTALPEVDFLEELRLRRWARENYCYAEARLASWHPIIHDEMRRRDAEETILNDVSVLMDYDDVPAPSDSTILTDLPLVEDAASVEPAEIIEPAATAQPRPFGPIVPLVPDLPNLHGPHEINPPHVRTGAGLPHTPQRSEMHYT